MTRDEKEISQRFAALRPITPVEVGGDEINLTWTVEKAPATLVGCLWVWNDDIEGYRWEAVRVTAISVDERTEKD